jgi:hypothetical protein
MTKLCKNCNWHKSHDYYRTGSGYYDECLCPDFKQEPSPVTGEERTNSCYFMRIYEDKCGKEGKYWTERQPPETKEGFWNRVFNFG